MNSLPENNIINFIEYKKAVETENPCRDVFGLATDKMKSHISSDFFYNRDITTYGVMDKLRKSKLVNSLLR